MVRRWFPRLTHPLLDQELARESKDDDNERAYRAVVSRLEPEVVGDAFVMNRHFEGRRWREVARSYLGKGTSVRVLDIGAGNGAIELAFSAVSSFLAFSVEREVNLTAVALHEATNTPFRRAIADGESLPYANATFDAVVCLETIEHVRNATRVGAELSRVLRPGGIILLTTPPRWRYAFAPDPHFGIRGLVLLPDAWQRRIAASRGFSEPHHHVETLFGSTVEITRLFPECRLAEVLSRSRAPKRWFWDAIVIRKQQQPFDVRNPV